jgi:hypothetical protein
VVTANDILSCNYAIDADTTYSRLITGSLTETYNFATNQARVQWSQRETSGTVGTCPSSQASQTITNTTDFIYDRTGTLILPRLNATVDPNQGPSSCSAPAPPPPSTTTYYIQTRDTSVLKVAGFDSPLIKSLREWPPRTVSLHSCLERQEKSGANMELGCGVTQAPSRT